MCENCLANLSLNHVHPSTHTFPLQQQNFKFHNKENAGERNLIMEVMMPPGIQTQFMDLSAQNEEEKKSHKKHCTVDESFKGH